MFFYPIYKFYYFVHQEYFLLLTLQHETAERENHSVSFFVHLKHWILFLFSIALYNFYLNTKVNYFMNAYIRVSIDNQNIHQGIMQIYYVKYNYFICFFRNFSQQNVDLDGNMQKNHQLLSYCLFSFQKALFF